jgi:hypothetical protein
MHGAGCNRCAAKAHAWRRMVSAREIEGGAQEHRHLVVEARAGSSELSKW